MGLNLINIVQLRFTDPTIAAIGGQLGLDPATAKSGSVILIPIILAAMARIARQRSGIDNVMEIIRTCQYDGSMIDRLPAMLSSGLADKIPGQGSVLIDKLLGPDADTITTSVAQHLGFKVSALRSLWLMLAPIVVDTIAGEIVAQKWGAEEFRNRLVSSQNELAKAMPPEIAEQLGLPGSSLRRESNDTESSVKSRGLDFSYVIAFIVSAIIVFALAQYVLKPKPIEETGQPALQDPADFATSPIVPEIVPGANANSEPAAP